MFFHGHSEQPVAGDTGEVLITTYQVVQTDQDKLCSGAGFAVLQTIAGYNKDMGVSKNRGIPKSSILIGFSIINHPFWGVSPLFLG